MTVKDATMEAEGLGDFFKSVGKSTKKLWKDANIPLRALELASILGTAAETKNSKATTGECIKVVQKTKKERGLKISIKNGIISYNYRLGFNFNYVLALTTTMTIDLALTMIFSFCLDLTRAVVFA